MTTIRLKDAVVITAEQQASAAWAAVRARRDALLAACD